MPDGAAVWDTFSSVSAASLYHHGADLAPNSNLARNSQMAWRYLRGAFDPVVESGSVHPLDSSQAEAWTPVAYLNASPDLKPTVERTKIWNEERDRVRVE